MIRVLVTGASGFVGAALSRWLAERGFRVAAVTRPGSDCWRIKDAFLPHFADLADPGSLLPIVESFRPDVIFHCAMFPGHPRSEADRWQCLRDSVQATESVVEIARACKTARVIFTGSAAVYRQSSEPLCETNPIDPATSRGAAKAAASILFRQFVRQHGIRGVELRLFSVYGPRESKSRFIPVVLRAAQTGEPIRLKRGPRHDFIHIDDVCQACEIAAQADVEPGEIFNIGSGVETANEDVVALAGRVTGRRIVIADEPHGGHPTDTAHWCADIAKARRVLGWSPQHTLASGLKATLEWSLCLA